MNIYELQNFLTLAENLHFGKTSQLCNLSPSALTRSIQRIEEDVGKPLFLRDNRTVTLTPAGEKFRDYASRALSDWKNILEEIKESSDIAGLITIYASVTAVYSILPELLESYRACFPEVDIELRTGSAEESIQQVLSGEIDVSIAALPDQPHPALAFQPLTETNLVFIAPRGQTELLDLSSTPLVIPRSGLSRRRLDQWFREKNIQPNINTEVSGNEGILAMVRLGCGVGVVPELVLERSPFKNEIQKINQAPKLTPYVVGLCTTRKNLRRPSIQALWELAASKQLS